MAKGSCCTIELTRGFTAVIDVADSRAISVHKWCALVSERKGIVYAVRSGRNQPGGKSLVMMHREILVALDGEFVDHINHNTLDNRRVNLRICTIPENNRNKRRNAKSASRFKGVFLLPGGSWRARITSNYKGIHIGCFASAKEAALAYDKAASELFGEFAMTNKSLGLLENISV